MLKRKQGLALISLVLSLVLSTSARGQTEEADIKAAFLFNFSKFITSTRLSISAQYTLCLYGPIKDRSAYFDLEKNKVRNRKIAVLSKSDRDTLSSCDIVYTELVDISTIKSLAKNSVQNSFILVGDAPNFIDHGGMIGLISGSNIRFELNQSQFENAGFKVSSKLYQLAVRLK